MLAIPRENNLFSVMSLGKLSMSGSSAVVWQRRLSAPAGLRVIVAATLIAASLVASAKDAPLVAIALFDGLKGPAYVQLTAITLNGKTELRVCDGIPKIDKKTYDVLPRVQILGASSLSRGADGLLTLTVNNKSLCVVPSNLRFDKTAEFTPSEAADQAVLQATPVSSSLPDVGLPAVKPGLQLIFVSAPDAEFAEFLRAQRANSINDWQDFISHYPASARVASARNAMADIHERTAEADFAQYRKSAAASKPDLVLLKHSYEAAQAAMRAVSGYRPAFDLMSSIAGELDALLEQDRTELNAFRKGLQEHTTGYSHVVTARRHIDRVLEIRTDYAPTINLRQDILLEEEHFNAALTAAESLVSAKRYDEAISSLGLYTAFSSEAQRVDAVLSAGYEYHFNRGRELAAQQNWEEATAEFRKAVSIRRDSQEASMALNTAMKQLETAHNQQAANLAVIQSDDYAGRGEFIEAYNTLAELSESQRALVANQLAALTRNYVLAASRRAQKLQESHLPIRARADEDAMREACDLLDRASSLSGDPALKLKHDFIAGKLSSYYIEQAKRMFDKPLGSGVGVGWLYLQKAEHYDANLGIAKDQLKELMAINAPIYQRRSRLSVGILIRDQTSRRDSAGFADQMADAIANGLEALGVPVDVIRRPAEVNDVTQPNFMVVGEILEHRVVKNTSLETLPSKYRAGTHDTKNPAWLQANSDYGTAQQQLGAAQHSLADAQAQHKKKEVIAAANDAVQQAQQHADELRQKLETTEQTRVEAIIEPYQYTKKNVDLAASIDLSIRIADRSGNTMPPPTRVHKDNHNAAVVLENVKPEDTEGIAAKGVEPDERQFLTDLEIQARNELVKAVHEKAAALLPMILQEARGRAQRGDRDGAAEEYVLYLNATPSSASAERDEALKFLRDQFDLSPLPAARP
jgi:hypothetical protein